MHRILVVDDSSTVLRFVAETLSNEGHHIISCGSGPSAANYLKNQAFDLLITDIYMPDCDGFEIIRDARRIDSKLPIIAISSNDGLTDVLTIATRLGANCYLRKPFTETKLISIVSTFLGQLS